MTWGTIVPETGVSIVIPQGAIDDGLEQEIFFQTV